MEKINEFYIKKEAEFKVRLEALVKKTSKPSISLREGFLQFQMDLAKLQKFVEINATGFRKILKKWDKRTKAHTKEIYLSRKIEIQPCFNREVLGELVDLASTHLSSLEKLFIDFEPVEFDFQSLVNVLDHKQHLIDFLSKQSITKEIISRVYLDHCVKTPLECLEILLKTGNVDCNVTNDIGNQSCVHALAIAGKLDALNLSLQYGV